MSDQASDEGQGLGPDAAGIVLAMSIAGPDADQDAMGELLIRHFNPMAVMEAQMTLMAVGLGAGLGKALESAFGGDGSGADSIMTELHAKAAAVLDGAGREAQLKAIGLGLKIAEMDGEISDQEDQALGSLLQRFGLSVPEVEAYVEEHMAVGASTGSKELTVDEASMIFAALVSQGDAAELPRTGPEADFARSQFSQDVAFGLMSKLPAEPPEDLPERGDPMIAYFTPMVLPALEKADDAARLRALAIGLRIAEIDGEIDAAEQATLDRYSKALGHDLAAVRAWAAEHLPASGASSS